VGIYIGSGNVIEAQTGSVQKVATISLSNSYWSGAYMTARRIFG
jgi:cell wall-associated NlpC family hydrolase